MIKKSILITGCSSGIGLCAAETLHRKGYRVFASARKDSDIEMLKAKGLETVKLDLDDSSSIQQAVSYVLQKTNGTLDALFNNAGFMLAGAVEDLTRDMIRSQFETNVFGQIELTNLILPVMHQQNSGRIIFNTSLLGIVTMPMRGVYSASKFALEAFAQTLRQELSGTPIFVSIIEPGPVESALSQHTYEHYQRELGGKTSFYAKYYQSMEKHLQTKSQSAFTQQPDIIADKLIDILESKTPKIRYKIGFPAYIIGLLRRLLPEKLLDKFILKMMKE